MLEDRVQGWTSQYLEEGRAEGVAESRARDQGIQRTFLCRMAARKFDAETASRLADRLKPHFYPEWMVEIGEGIVESEDGDELLARVEKLRARDMGTESLEVACAELHGLVQYCGAEWRAQGRAEGLAEGRARGRAKRAEVLCRMAARKFDAETASRLAEQLAETADPEWAGEVGKWLLECESGSELLDRFENPSPNTCANKMAVELLEIYKEWSEQQRAEGQAEGRARGRAEIIRRMTTRKFDAGSASHLIGLLAEVPDPERVAEVGEWIIECEDGNELLQRVERLCATSADGDGSSPGDAPSRG